MRRFLLKLANRFRKTHKQQLSSPRTDKDIIKSLWKLATAIALRSGKRPIMRQP